MNDVWPPAHTVMTEHGSKNELHIENEDRKECQGEQAGAALVEFDARLFLDPFLAGKYSHRYSDAEESLGQGGVSRRDWRRQEKEHSESTQDPLSNDRSERTDGEKP